MSPEILVKDGSKFNQASLDNLMVPDVTAYDFLYHDQSQHEVSVLVGDKII